MKLPEEAKKIDIFSKISKMDEEDEHSPSEFYYREGLETFDVETETCFTECHIINNLLTELARAILGNIGPRLWPYGPRYTLSVLPRPQVNIPQYGPCARLVSG